MDKLLLIKSRLEIQMQENKVMWENTGNPFWRGAFEAMENALALVEKMIRETFSS